MACLSIEDKILQVAGLCTSQGVVIATAESCTGGMIAAAMTDVAGASRWFERSFVTYTNTAKHEMLGVAEKIFEEHGAVSAECVSAMLAGALKHSHADLAVAVSGIAGPGGAEPGKPVGTVFIGWRRAGEAAHVERLSFDGDRRSVREATVSAALDGIIKMLSKNTEGK